MKTEKDCWTVLGVTSTTNRRLIKRAYVEHIKACCPDERPMEFARLQQAYKEAEVLSFVLDSRPERAAPAPAKLELPPAVTPESPEQTTALPLLPWTDRIYTPGTLEEAMEMVWEDRRLRFQQEVWECLLREPVFADPERRNETATTCLAFVCRRPFIPYVVYLYLNEIFGFRDGAWSPSDRDGERLVETFLRLLSVAPFYLDFEFVASFGGDNAQLEHYLRRRRLVEDLYLLQRADVAEIETAYHEAMQAFDGDRALHALMARVFLQSGDSAKAIGCLRTLASRWGRPDDLLALGRLLLARGEHAKARPLFRRVVEHAPSTGEALKGLGVCYWRCGQLDAAEALLDEAAALVPHDYEARVGLAQVRLEMFERLSKRRRQWKRHEALLAGELLFALGRFKEAYALTNSMSFASVFENGFSTLGPRALAALGADARRGFADVIKRSIKRGRSGVDAAKEMIIFCGATLDQKQLAWLKQEFLNGLLHQGAHDPDYYYAAALLCRHLAQRQPDTGEESHEHWRSAAAAVQVALSRDPRNVDYNLAAGEIFYHVRRFNQALEYLSYASKSEMFDGFVAYLKGQCHWQMNQPELAARCYEEALELRILDRLSSADSKELYDKLSKAYEGREPGKSRYYRQLLAEVA